MVYPLGSQDGKVMWSTCSSAYVDVGQQAPFKAQLSCISAFGRLFRSSQLERGGARPDFLYTDFATYVCGHSSPPAITRENVFNISLSQIQNFSCCHTSRQCFVSGKPGTALPESAFRRCEGSTAITVWLSRDFIPVYHTRPEALHLQLCSGQ